MPIGIEVLFESIFCDILKIKKERNFLDKGGKFLLESGEIVG